MSNASSATNFFPNSLRLMWFDQGCLLNLFGVLLFFSTLGVAGGLVFQSETGVLSFLCWVVGLVMGVLTLVIGGVIIWVALAMRVNFKNGILTAGMVTKVSPPSLIHIAVLSSGGTKENYRYGILRQNCERLPKSL